MGTIPSLIRRPCSGAAAIIQVECLVELGAPMSDQSSVKESHVNGLIWMMGVAVIFYSGLGVGQML